MYFSGIVVTRVEPTGGPTVDLVSSNIMSDYSFVRQPFTLDASNATFRCASGLGPSGFDFNTEVGRWHFANGSQLLVPPGDEVCGFYHLELRGAPTRRIPGVINVLLCDSLTPDTEGVYSCIMMNSSMMNQTMRVGVYFSGRSE